MLALLSRQARSAFHCLWPLPACMICGIASAKLGAALCASLCELCCVVFSPADGAVLKCGCVAILWRSTPSCVIVSILSCYFYPLLGIDFLALAYEYSLFDRVYYVRLVPCSIVEFIYVCLLHGSVSCMALCSRRFATRCLMSRSRRSQSLLKEWRKANTLS